jgi:S-adenosylmethionine hydrolase
VGRPVVFLSDLGTRDESVGACRLVIERGAPGTTVIDLSHGVPIQDVLTGAILLADGLPFLPPHAVVLAVVDPGSGTDRRAVAIETARGVCARRAGQRPAVTRVAGARGDRERGGDHLARRGPAV